MLDPLDEEELDDAELHVALSLKNLNITPFVPRHPGTNPLQVGVNPPRGVKF